MAECIDLVKKSIPDATPDELNDILGQINERFARIMQEGGKRAEEAVAQASQEVVDAMKLAALIEKRNAVINKNVRMQAVDFIRTSFPDNPMLGVEALLVGVQQARKGARSHVGSAQRALEKKYFAFIESGLDRENLRPFFIRPEMQADIARALWSIDDQAALKNLPAEAVSIAKVINEAQEMARADANKAGAWIGKIKGYITRQSHDQIRLMRAGKDAWIAAVKPKLDYNRMFPSGAPDNIDNWLAQTYENIITGNHTKLDSDAAKMAAFKGPANLAKKASAERVLHFKSADDWLAYNEQFGVGNVAESVMSGFLRASESNGLMQVLGTNPEFNLKAIIEAAESATEIKTPKDVDRLSAAKKRVDNYYKQVSGQTRNPVNAKVARRMANVRSGVRLATLGGVVLSSLGDPFLRASELRYQGKGLFSDIADGYASILKGRSQPERMRILMELEEYSESVISDIARRWDPEDQAGSAMSWMERKFFKFNLMNEWTNRSRAGASMAISRHVADYHGKPWTEVPEALKRVFSLYKIEEADWAAINKAELSMESGRKYVTTEQIQKVDKAVADKYRRYLADRIDFAYLTPDAKTQATMNQGLQPGTVPGEAIRAFMQLKTFPIAMIQKIVGREMFGYGATSWRDMGAQEMRGLATLIVGTTIFGYMAMTAKDMMKGKEPRPIDDKRTWIAAAMQGGALGIYGDFLFGQNARNGAGMLATLAGPLFGKADDLHNILSKTAKGVEEGEIKADVAAKLMRFTVNNLPGNNIFWLRPAMDYAILYEIQEALSPGYLRRMEARAKRDNEQTYWLSPQEAVR